MPSPNVSAQPTSSPLTGQSTAGKRLRDQLIDELRLRHYSPRTERAYVGWVRRFVRFCNNRHPSTLGRQDVQRYLTWLARNQKVSASTQGQALAALLFFYDAVMRQPIEAFEPLVRAKRPLLVPVVLTPSEVQRLFEHMTGCALLMASLLYGSGLRVLECARLRVKDLDLERAEIRVRCGKGAKDRLVPLAHNLIELFRCHLAAVRKQHDADLRAGAGWVELPDSLSRKYTNAGRD